MTAIHDPGGKGEHIEELYVILVEHNGPDDEGLASAVTSVGIMPLCATDKEHAGLLEIMAAQLIEEGVTKRMRLVRFTQREDLKTIERLAPEVP